MMRTVGAVKTAALPMMAQLAVSVPAAARAVGGSMTHTGLRDESLLLKTVLTEALGGAVVRPWRLVGMLEGTATILGYTALPESDLRARLAYATPALRQTVSIVGAAELPALVPSQSLRFIVRLVPTVRQTGKGEIDALLYAVRQSPDELHDRAAVYANYLTRRLTGAAVEAAKMDGFRLAKMVRHTQRMFPVAEMSGVFRINDATALAEVIEAGIGRQRAYGFGFLRIEPC